MIFSFQEPNVSNSHPISQYGRTEPRREKSNSTLKEKPETLDKFKPRCLNRKDPDSPTKRIRDEADDRII
ncbi:hypothetical protein OIU85_013337 [Salix viminalis]|uniref:Uncharacterized protein n=1 Tax=Salix viminalis TaxID=40686 RepID=A0A9Q0NLK1_SALVM|nr:hypothetical protein OIU85_013337 [Salix viminalis]